MVHELGCTRLVLAGGACVEVNRGAVPHRQGPRQPPLSGTPTAAEQQSLPFGRSWDVSRCGIGGGCQDVGQGRQLLAKGVMLAELTEWTSPFCWTRTYLHQLHAISRPKSNHDTYKRIRMRISHVT